MAGHALDELLTTLDVRVHAVALSNVRPRHRLVFDPMTMVTIHYVLQGRGVIQVGGQSPIEFGPQSVLIVPPGGRVTLGDVHAEREVDAKSAVNLICDGLLLFEAGQGTEGILIASGTITATFAGGFGLFDRLSDPMLQDVGDAPFLASAFNELLGEVSAPGLASRAYTETLMRQCLLLVLRSHFAASGPQSPLFTALKDVRLVRAVTAVLTRPSERHTLQSLAAEAGMSRSVFVERFNQAFEQTPFEFVQKVRLRHAAHLLHATDLPVKLIAEAAGFASRSHFSRAFSAAYGCDPSAYRDMRLKVDASVIPDGPRAPPEPTSRG